MFMNKLKDKLKKDKNIDILYSRPQKTKDITFHWNVFSIYYAKQENNSIYLKCYEVMIHEKETIN